MLTHLSISNYTIVPELDIELAGGMTVITGETGAGKSIILGALNLLLGQRADRSLIRAGADNCSRFAEHFYSRTRILQRQPMIRMSRIALDVMARCALWSD